MPQKCKSIVKKYHWLCSVFTAAMQILYNESSNVNILDINTFEASDNQNNIIIDNLHDQPTDDISNLSINYRGR